MKITRQIETDRKRNRQKLFKYLTGTTQIISHPSKQQSFPSPHWLSGPHIGGSNLGGHSSPLWLSAGHSINWILAGAASESDPGGPGFPGRPCGPAFPAPPAGPSSP